MKTGRILEDQEKDDISAAGHELSEFPQSNCCYSHDWPYFTEPVPPYDYSKDWDLEEEWNRRQDEYAEDRKSGGGNSVRPLVTRHAQ
jgi:hypothetical protein